MASREQRIESMWETRLILGGIWGRTRMADDVRSWSCVCLLGEDQRRAQNGARDVIGRLGDGLSYLTAGGDGGNRCAKAREMCVVVAVRNEYVGSEMPEAQAQHDIPILRV
jgi:hypothetical protein